MNTQVKEFLATFNKRPSPPIELARKWLAVLETPQDAEANPDKLANDRRKARQNLRRLLNRYPMLISVLKNERTA